ncbi:hypothetical protein ACFYTV_31560 [Streptomyces sp. NPDC004562]|uniref:hypothetical protein n=1 Tax=Streptomyces sp. NPDC004562 TaxID=3364703 RepID=UPI0036A426E0
MKVVKDTPACGALTAKATNGSTAWHKALDRMPGAMIGAAWKFGVTSVSITSGTVPRIERAAAWQRVLKSVTFT